MFTDLRARMISQLYSSSYCLKEFLRNLQIYMSKLREQIADINTGGNNPTSSLFHFYFSVKNRQNVTLIQNFGKNSLFFPLKPSTETFDTSPRTWN
jgi:hypothetical protein